MPSIYRTATVIYSDQQMFDLVNDVSAYPEFLPGCVKAQVIEHTDTMMLARLHLGKGGLTASFLTHNYLSAPQSISMRLEEGPLQNLTGNWTFTELQDQGNKVQGCKVEMQVDFTVKGLAAIAVSGLYSQMTATMVDAFCERAKYIYG